MNRKHAYAVIAAFLFFCLVCLVGCEKKEQPGTQWRPAGGTHYLTNEAELDAMNGAGREAQRQHDQLENFRNNAKMFGY